MTETEAIRLFKCLSDKSRLQILKSLAMEDMYVERLAERLGITAPTVSFHLKKLADAGAVTSYKSQYYTMYSLNKDIFETSYTVALLSSIPTTEADSAEKERIILEVIVQEFEYDRIYSEREVNIIIADFYDDFCTIRRDMIGEGLMDRDTRGYWRVRH